MNRTPAVKEQSRALALELQTTVRLTPNANVIEVRSRNRKTPNTWYAMTRGVDDTLICSCPASFNRLGCWHLNTARGFFGDSEAKRFWAKVAVIDDADSCWLWTGAHDKYGHFGRGSLTDGTRRTDNAHAVAFEFFYGRAEGQVLHHCDTPLCCRPSHLYDGTPADNMRDKVDRGRDHNRQKTHCPQGHEYDEENTLLVNGGRHRLCRACHRARSLARYHEARKVFDMTTETRALVPIVLKPSMDLLPSSHDLDVVDRAAAMAYAGAVALPAELNSKEKVAAVMLYGLELGLKPMTALRHLYIVKGRVSPSAELMAGLCMAKERDIEFHIEQLTDKVCTIRMVRPSRRINEPYTVRWQQIIDAGLAQGANKQYPEDRLRYHCMKRLMRAYAQDLINNLDEVVLPGLSEGQPWRPTVVDNSDLYNEGDVPENVDRETGEIHEATQQAPVSASAGTEGLPSTTPAAPSPKTVPVGDVPELLNAIKERHGQQAKVAAINVMSRFFDTQVVTKLNHDEREEYAAMLRVRLDGIEHEHKGAFTAYGHPVCSICGDDVKPPEGETEAPAQQPSLVT